MANEQPILMSEADAGRLMRLLRKTFRGSGGIEVTDTDQGCVIRLSGGGQRSQPTRLKYKAEIAARVAHPTEPSRFLYEHFEVVRNPIGVGWEWTPLAGGRSGTVSENPAQNHAEGEYATPQGIRLACGVLKSNLPSTFTQAAVPEGSVVEMEVIQNADGSIEYWFERCVIPDGACPP